QRWPTPSPEETLCPFSGRQEQFPHLPHGRCPSERFDRRLPPLCPHKRQSRGRPPEVPPPARKILPRYTTAAAPASVRRSFPLGCHVGEGLCPPAGRSTVRAPLPGAFPGVFPRRKLDTTPALSRTGQRPQGRPAGRRAPST